MISSISFEQNSMVSVPLSTERLQTAWQRGLFNSFEGKLGKYQAHKEYPSILSLFAIAIDPEMGEGEKRELIKSELNKLKPSIADHFAADLPNCIAIHILRYVKGSWSQLFWRISEVDGIYCEWVKEVMEVNWPSETKQNFIKRLFLTQAHRYDDRTEHILRKMVLSFDKDQEVAFLKLCEESIAGIWKKVSADLFGLKGYCGRHEERFIQFFKRKGLEHQDAARITIELGSSTWHELSSLPNFSDLAVKWIVEIGRGEEKKEKKFYRGSTQSLRTEITDQQAQTVAEAIRVENLCRNFKFMSDPFQNQLMKVMVDSYPEKLINWFQPIFESEKISRGDLVVKCLKRNGLLTSAISIVFDEARNCHEAMVHFFAALDRAGRKEVFHYLKESNSNWIAVLTDWASLCAGSLPPYIGDEFAKDLLLLQEVDSEAPSQMRESLQKMKMEDFAKRALPEKFNLQEHAIVQLQKHFQRKTIAPERRARFVDSIREDLKGEEEGWIYTLFEKLSKELWPQIFDHFFEEVVGSKKGWIKVLKTEGDPKAPKCIPDLEKWIETCSEALSHASEKQCVEAIYFAAQETNCLELLFKRIAKRVSPERFTKLLNLMSSRTFCPFIHPLSQALKEVSVEYLADCVASPASYECCTRSYRVQDHFWSESFLPSHEEVSSFAKQLIRQKGVDALLRLRKDRLERAVAGLKNTDLEYCKNLFSKLFNEISSSSSIEEKVILFQDLCKAYRLAGLDVFELLKPLDLSTIRNWNWSKSLSRAGDHFPWPLAVELFRFIKPTLLFPALFKQAEDMALYLRIFNKVFSSFNKMLVGLEEVGLDKEFMDQLFHEEHEDLRKGLNILFKHDLICCIVEGSTLSSLLRIVPEWKERLVEQIKKIIQDHDNQFTIYPGKQTVVQLYHVLHKAGYLEELNKKLKESKIDESELDAFDQTFRSQLNEK